MLTVGTDQGRYQLHVRITYSRGTFIDIGLKAKFWLIILEYKNSKSCNVNGDGNENDIKINRSTLISKKKKQIFTCSTLFFLISKKAGADGLLAKKGSFHVQHAFLSFFAVVMHLRYGDYGPRLRLNMLLRMIRTT